MKSQGTKETQGINGDAAALQRQLDVALQFAGDLAPCAYPRHRPSDWVTPGARHVQCGICHPPATEFEGLCRRRDDGFAELEAAALAAGAPS